MKLLINILQGEHLSPHKHKNYEIIIYIKGNGVFKTGEKDIAISPGTIVIIPPGITHYSSSSDSDFERIYISGTFNHLFNITSVSVINDTLPGEGVTLAKMIYKNRFSDSEYLDALVSAFELFLLKNVEIYNDITSAVNKIVDKITNNYCNCNIDLCYILNKSGYSEDYIRSMFKKIKGKTPVEFLTEIRISHARFLIEAFGSSICLADVAEKCGFDDYVYFSRRFKQITGISPRKYTELHTTHQI